MNELPATTNQKLIAGVLSAGAFVGCLLYGVKRNHPWIGFVAGISASAVVSMGAYAAMGAKMPELPTGTPRTEVIATTPGGGAVAVSTPTPPENPGATTTSTRT